MRQPPTRSVGGCTLFVSRSAGSQFLHSHQIAPQQKPLFEFSLCASRLPQFAIINPPRQITTGCKNAQSAIDNPQSEIPLKRLEKHRPSLRKGKEAKKRSKIKTANGSFRADVQKGKGI
jgi:hypothetical protein